MFPSHLGHPCPDIAWHGLVPAFKHCVVIAEDDDKSYEMNPIGLWFKQGMYKDEREVRERCPINEYHSNSIVEKIRGAFTITCIYTFCSYLIK